MGIDLPTHLQSAAGEQGRKGYAPEEKNLSIVEGVYSEPDENQDICWYHSIFGIYNPETHSWEREEPVVISEDEATVIRDSWPRRADFPLTYFSEYTPDGNQNQNLTFQDILEK